MDEQMAHASLRCHERDFDLYYSQVEGVLHLSDEEALSIAISLDQRFDIASE